MSGLKIDRLLVIGVGLIGGSFAMALRKAGVVREIVGASRSLENLELGVELGVIDRYTLDFPAEIENSDVVFVAAPLLSIDPIFEKISQSNYHNCVITDAGSVKCSVVESAERHFSASFRGFVAAHPIAGREHSGVAAASDSLFSDRRTIITPSAQSGVEATRLVEDLWRSCGSTVTSMGMERHDELVSASSHLPHLIAFGLVNYIAGHANGKDCFDLAAAGFYDFTRIASSDPIMWRDICLTNADAIVRELHGYMENLRQLAVKIKCGDGDAVEAMMRIAKTSRDHYLQQWKK